jgi:hypothetical protein
VYVLARQKMTLFPFSLLQDLYLREYLRTKKSRKHMRRKEEIKNTTLQHWKASSIIEEKALNTNHNPHPLLVLPNPIVPAGDLSLSSPFSDTPQLHKQAEPHQPAKHPPSQEQSQSQASIASHSHFLPHYLQTHSPAQD